MRCLLLNVRVFIVHRLHACTGTDLQLQKPVRFGATAASGIPSKPGNTAHQTLRAVG
jgi:hypothetical protein